MSIFDPNCQRCVLSKRPRKLERAVCVPGDGPEPCDILFYGEAPGENEELENRPFVGGAGSELDSLLRQAGLRRKNVRISNIVRCRPPGNRNPTKDEIAACMFYTLRELELVRPKVIVAVGASAIKALTGKGEVGKNRGKLLPLLSEYRSSIPVIPTYHPAAFLHNPGNRASFSKAIVEDIRLARKAVKGDAIDAVIATGFATDAATQDEVLDKLSRADDLACDLEWEVLPEKRKDPKGMWPWSRRGGRRPRRVSISIAAEVDGKMYACAAKFRSPAADRIRQLVCAKPTYYHNGIADLIWLYSMGWRVHSLADDTLVLASLLNLDTSLSLKALAASLTSMPPGWETEAKVGEYPHTTQDWRDTLTYNAKDTIATVLLRKKLLRMVAKQGREEVLSLYRHILLPAVTILARTALAGVPIDGKLLKRHENRAERRLTRLYGEVCVALGLSKDATAVLRSDAQLGPILEREAKIILPRTAKTQRASVTGDILQQNKNAHPAIPKLIKTRKTEKQRNAYWHPWRWLLDAQGDARLHSVYRLTHARTGRTSAEGEYGNTFQQFLRGQQWRDLVRADEGKVIVAVDQSQIELRVAAFLAKEKRMLEAFKDERDLHTLTAGMVKALDKGVGLKQYLREQEKWMAAVTKDERFGAKAFNFGLLYAGKEGVVVRTARRDYGITLTPDQAVRGRDAYFQLYPSLAAWHDSCWRYVEQGWCETLFHRRRPILVAEYEDEEAKLRKAINTPVQSFASDLALFCMDYTWELLEREYGRNVWDKMENTGFFHDAALLHVPRSEASAVRAIVKEAWEHPPLDRVNVEFPVPLVADITVGKRWGEDSA